MAYERFRRMTILIVNNLHNPIALLTLILVASSFSAPFGAPKLAAFAKDLLPTAATLIAAYAGAWYAFSFNQAAISKDLRSRQAATGARAMFTLWRQINTIAQVQEDVINKYRNYPPAPLAMPPISIHSEGTVRIDIDGLGFLLDHKKPDLLANICIAETRYIQALDSIRQRSDLHKNEIQPKIEDKIPLDRNLSPEELREIVGTRLFHQLVEQTKSVIARTDDAVETLETVAADLHAALKSIFPEARFPHPAPMDEDPVTPSPRPTGLL